ncbi:MAG: hypothetical protein APZ16_04220 [Candidatus Hadarchaeum yellowstonense]|uniref:DUF2905 domain-containing protein n=1 Tax=Hadarchaeum yellowstonense TaxID=1776334 RepID=A0A147K0W1_HADYE|nr:MAG: hypothetical protein APZ16_04220 [Candidatus Hadarchaeum yellowstonense]
MLGIAFILIGIALVLIPVIGNYVDLSRVPWWIIYVYRSDGFVFVTSPILLILSAVSIIIAILSR